MSFGEVGAAGGGGRTNERTAGMDKFKYTTDGKKVAVIGKLNNAETIVQEIYVGKDGSEIPAGEQFVVKSLLDEPRETWLSKKTREIEDTYKRMDKELDRRCREMRSAEDFAKAKVASLKKLGNAAADEQLATLEAFAEGKITHLVESASYSGPTIAPFDEKLADYWDGRVEGIKLLTLFGESDGSLSWRLNQYSDGSGGRHEVIPVWSYDEAVSIVQGLHDARIQAWRDGKITSPPSPKWDRMPDGITSPDDVVEFHRAKRDEQRKQRIEKLREELGKLEKERKE